MVVSMSKKEFSRLSVLMNVEGGRLRVEFRRGAVAPAAAPAGVPAAQGSSDRRRGEPGVQAPRRAEQQQAAARRSGI